MGLSVDQRIEFTILIKETLNKVEKEVEQIELMTQPVKPENSLGRISRMDAINNKSVMEAALRNKKAKLAKLKMALSRVEHEEFGICSRCHAMIQYARLMYLPESSYCVSCASKSV